ncbi:cellulose binding domain-containing protein [Dactylosporangium salmoneum]|uniref:CBM2 domain-containing protein n=1 Tax=Dactylosporangium salmoneum TaxID=53361 RepID=A0ABN3FD37_9ACTN
MNHYRWLRPAVVGVLALVGLGAVASPAQSAAVPTATFAEQSEWSTGYVGAYTIANPTAAPLTWRVEFDLPATTAIGTSWGAQITHTGTHYTAVGESWNATLAAGAGTTFGWVAQGLAAPTGCRLNGADCDGRPAAPDIRPPSTPGNLRAVVGTNTLTLRWDPSADDTAVAGYEVYMGQNLAATVTGTEYVMPTPPPMIITYRVRALDAAGNASPFAVLTPGGPADTTPPTAPTGLRFAGTATGFTLGWTAATDNVAVAGYDVSVNGDHYGATSNTSLTVPPLGYGAFAFSIVAFDGAGNRSAPLAVSLAIDPMPNSDTHPPTPPADLRVSLTATQVTWSWTAATDNVGVAGYQVFHGSDWAGNVTGTTYTEPRQPGQTTFGIRVRAYDAVGNKSIFASATVAE